MVTASKNTLGIGAYSIPQAARLVGAHYNTLRSWISPDSGVIPRHFDPECQKLSFIELMELHFIKLFRDEGVSLQTIRMTAVAASKKFRSDYPFAVKRFDTDGKTIFATLKKRARDGEVVEDLRKGQLVFTQIMRPFFKKLDYKKTEVSRYWPLGKRSRIVLDPTRRFGQPIDDTTGIATSILYTATQAGKGQSVREVAAWYGVPEAAVKRAIEFERSIAS